MVEPAHVTLLCC